MKLRVELGGGLSTGLFTDQRDTRAMVRASTAGARILNLFAYTCSFTLAAALGGATTTTSVDVSQRALTWGNDNLVLNGVAGAAHRLLRGDAVSFLKRARRRGDRFDLVVLDPPSFGTHGRSTFSAPRDYGPIAEDALALVAPRGRLIAVTNHLGTSRAALRTLIQRAAASARVGLDKMSDLPMPPDYPFRVDGEEPTKTVIATLAG
jgi:23S rRNA (cytosine1962-C5)-methyltransferase